MTTNGSIDVMRKPASGRELTAEARLLKQGWVLAVGDVLIYTDGVVDPVARATLNYWIAPRRSTSGPQLQPLRLDY